jgi:hypothetical protein
MENRSWNRPPHTSRGSLSLMRRELILVRLLLLVAACGGPSAPASRPGDGHPSHETLTVYDATGASQTCTPPASDCPPLAPNRDFAEACQRGGFRMQRCGCDSLCTGKVEEAFYDGAGAKKACAPPKDECEPPPAAASFQDACTERGFHLQACACDEWLCSGDPTK